MANNKLFKGTLLLVSMAAAFAYYKYSRLSPDEKNDLAESIKEKSRKLYDQFLPDELKRVFDSKDTGSYASDFESGEQFSRKLK